MVGGAGVASLVAGFGVGGLALSKKNASNAGGNCPNDTCNAAGQALRQQALGAATASTALVVVGAVLGGAGGVLLFTAPSSTPKGSGATPAPEVSLGLGTIAMRLTF